MPVPEQVANTPSPFDLERFVLAQDDRYPQALAELKFRSCLTLFAAADPQRTDFPDALRQFFAGQPCPKTRMLLGQA